MTREQQQLQDKYGQAFHRIFFTIIRMSAFIPSVDKTNCDGKALIMDNLILG